MATEKHEVVAAAAVKRFMKLLDSAPRCKCGGSCETRAWLLREIKPMIKQADELLASLFDEVLLT